MGFFLSVLSVFVLIIPSPVAAAVQRSAPQLTPLWAKLDAAKDAYRGGGFPIGKSYSQSVASWEQDITAPIDYGQTPREIFEELALSESGFRQYLSNSDIAAEATAGIQEAINELIAGQTLVGNDLLIRGLRARFPGVASNVDAQRPVELLAESVSAFRAGINDTIEELRLRPLGLRSRKQLGDNVSFDEMVENSPRMSGQGEAVFNEFYRFSNLAYRHALAANSLGRRKFFYENTSEDGRKDAARELKRSAQATYLNTALLTALQDDSEFNRNRGYELKRQVIEAQRTFDDIQSGFNPLKLLGDFVPRQPVESFLRLFSDLVATARTDEDAYQDRLRNFDVNQTTLNSELLNQQEKYLDDMELVTGIPSALVSSTFGALEDAESRSRYIVAADLAMADQTNAGQLRQAQLAIDQAGLDAVAAYEEMRQIPERIRIEESRSGQVASLVTRNGMSLSASTLAIGMLQAVSVSQSVAVSVGAQMGTTTTTSVSFNPYQPHIAAIQAGQTLLQALQSAAIEGINSAATIKGLLLQQATAAIAIERAANALRARQAELEQLRARLQRTVRNYVSARRNLSTAYFADPAYRMEADLAKENADNSFEAAMIQGYFTAKALEYEWAERFANPVERIGVGNPVSIGEANQFAPFVAAESVFSCRSVANGGSPAPRLNDFRSALAAWDQLMRQQRGNEQQPEFVEILSLRKDILGYVGGDENVNRILFADFLKRNRVPGRNALKDDVLIPFSLSIADQRLFPAEPNLKLVSMSLNIKSRPPRVAAEAGRSRPFRVEMVMLDEAVLRTFFADYSHNPPDDDLLVIDLEEGRSLSTSPFRALMQATLDGTPAGLPANVQLANLSPAVTRWVMRIDMSNGENVYLIPEYIDDIEMRITYKFGRPRSFTF